MGMSEVPVQYQNFEDDDEERGFLVSDNAIASWAELDLSLINTQLGDFDPGFDLDLLGIKDFTLDMSDKEFGSGEDEVPAAPPEPVVKRGELWVLGEHRLLIDDCTVKENVERLMAGEKADMVFTSPPYSDQRDYGGGLVLDPKHLAKFLQWPADLFAVNLGLQKREHEIVQYWNDYICFAKEIGLKLLSWNVWDKQACGSVGHQTAMFPMEHEWIFVWGKAPKDLNKTEENKWAGILSTGNSQREKDGSITKREDIVVGSHRPIGTVLRVPPHKARNLDFDHPAMFPVEFPEKYILAITGLSGSVGEPFCGSGTTLIACEKTGRRCFGMEIDPHYGQVIIERWQKFSGKKAVREDGVTFDSLKIE